MSRIFSPPETKKYKGSFVFGNLLKSNVKESFDAQQLCYKEIKTRSWYPGISIH